MRPSASGKIAQRAELVREPVGASRASSSCVMPSRTSRPGPIAPVARRRRSPRRAPRAGRARASARPRAARPRPARGRRRRGARRVPSSSPARWVRRGTMSIRQQKWSAPRGAVRTQRLSGGRRAERAPQPRERVVQQRGAERAVVLEAGARAARGEHELERAAATRTAPSAPPRRRSATIRSRRRTSSCTRSPSRLPPIVRIACAPKRSRSRATRRGRSRARRAARACAGARRRPRGPR